MLISVLYRLHSSMTETLTKIFASTEKHLQQLYENLKDDGGEIKLTENFILEDFCLKFENVVEEISRTTTQIAMAYTKPPFPSAKETQELINSIEGSADCLASLYSLLPKELGNYFHHDMYILVKDILSALLDFIQSLGLKGSRGSKERLKAAGCVFNACEEAKEMPKNNLKSIINLLHNEELLLLDALQEIDKEVISDYSAQKFGEEIDNTEMWNNQDRELLPPCIALVKAARSSLKKIKSSMTAKGDCKTLDNISELDSVALIAKDLSPAVDSFVVAIYPPMNQKLVKRAARDVVNIIQKLLNQVQKCHFVTDEDHKWLSFLLKAVDHNNNKLQPLLSQERANDCDVSDA